MELNARAPVLQRLARIARVLALTPFVLTGACDDSSAGLPAAPGLPVALTVDFAGGAAHAFDAADVIAIRVERAGVVVLEETMPFSSGGSDVRIRVPVDPALDGALLDLAIELRRGADPLFVGSGAVRASASPRDPAEIALAPVVAAIVAPPNTRIAAIGASLQLAAAAVFATGDTITTVTVSYQLLDQGVIRLLPGGIAVGDREGIARVRASAGGRSLDFEVEVRIAAATVDVEPASAIIGIGRTLRLVAAVFDANGRPLSRQPAWSSADPSVATVSADGTVTGVAAGTVTITAAVDDARGSSLIEVSSTPPPAQPTGLASSASGTVITLSWQDNASGETAYEILRGPMGGTLATIASLPPDSRLFTDGGLPIDQVLDYVVRVCNGAVCSESDRITARTVPAPPSSLTEVANDPVTYLFRIGWSDNSVAETSFNIQIYDPGTQQFETFADAPGNATEYQGTGTPASTDRYRVRACNEAGCSGPTNEISISFGLAPPVAITLPTFTHTEMVGTTDGYGQPHDWYFEFYEDPTFVDANATNPMSTTSSGQREYPLFDLFSLEKVYYRIIAENAAGSTIGATRMLVAPNLAQNPPSTTTVCNQGASCSANPSTITFTAVSTGPVGTYPNPFQFVSFDIESPFIPLGSGSVSAEDNAGTGLRTWTWTLTIDPQAAGLSLGNYTLVVRGYPGSSSGNVVTSSIAFTVTSF